MTHKETFSRKDFINVSGAGLLGLMGTQFKSFRNLSPQLQGRVIYDRITLFNKPSLDSQEKRLKWKDDVIPITQVTIGDREPSHNRIWYKIGNQGFAHSGGVQPVQTSLNPVVEDLPDYGALAEVSVPFTDALWEPGATYRVAYRLYYETTHWVKDVTYADDGTAYYQILEDKWDWEYFVPARHLRIIPHRELTMISPHVPSYAKRIEVYTEKQMVVAFEWDKPVYMVKASTGSKFSTGVYSTPAGRHITNYKRPSRHMARGNLAHNGYDLPGVPWVINITDDGIALHGTYWHNDFGQPRSHGCINLPSKAAKWFYRWTLPYVPPHEKMMYDKAGTSVNVISGT
ncbi:MAG: L,D-transpeptidase [Anaerolineales bacterium]|nr:L,D-transpeptidase [Anaerolineales bacterium]